MLYLDCPPHPNPLPPGERGRNLTRLKRLEPFFQHIVLGYRAGFLVPAEALLQATLPALRDEALATYVRTLLRAFASKQGKAQISPAENASLPLEPLSPQEQRVLRLLAAGRSNPEIAEALIVSINTVKTQVQSIYRKLHVQNRWEAREAAQRLHLL